MLNGRKPIASAVQVKQRVQEDSEAQVSRQKVRQVLREELHLRYRRTKKVPQQANSERCKVLRQQYALTLLSLLEQGKRIIQVDETWLNESNFTRLTWNRKGAVSSVPTKAISPSLSMIAALDTDGLVYFCLSHATTDQDTFMLFLRHLVAKLDQDSPGWEANSYIAMDNAAWHSGQDIRSYMRKMELPFLYSGPYSYSAAAIETLFAHLKLGELNPDRLPTGKK